VKSPGKFYKSPGVIQTNDLYQNNESPGYYAISPG